MDCQNQGNKTSQIVVQDQGNEPPETGGLNKGNKLHQIYIQNQDDEPLQVVVQDQSDKPPETDGQNQNDRTAQWPKGKALICSVRIA